MELPWTSYGHYLRQLFPVWPEVRKASLNGGFTCPNLDGSKATGGCIYCDNRSFSIAAPRRGSDIRAQIDASIPRLRKRHPGAGILAYFQPWSNTYAPVERLEELYGEALAHPEVCGMAIGTRPDCVGTEVRDLLERLAGQKPVILELGLQSSNDATLARINRAHTAADWVAAWKLFRGGGPARDLLAMSAPELRASRVQLSAHVILGLPGEGPAEWRATARLLAQHPVQTVKIHPLHVVRGTELHRQYEAGEYRPLTLEQYAQGVVDFVRELPPETIVERVSGETAEGMTVAPEWSGKRTPIVRAVLAAWSRPPAEGGPARNPQES
jgi:radical SAM protein (TIGR01212 family)